MSRTLDQNAKLQAMCHDLAREVRLTPDGRYVHVSECPSGRQIDNDSWRYMFCGTVLGWVTLPAIEGAGFIMLGASSRKLDIQSCADVITLMQAFGDERGIAWHDPEWQSLVKEVQGG